MMPEPQPSRSLSERSWLSVALFTFMDAVLRKGASGKLDPADCLPLPPIDLCSPCAGAWPVVGVLSLPHCGLVQTPLMQRFVNSRGA